jgi:gamma-glutamylputrescine oxidase
VRRLHHRRRLHWCFGSLSSDQAGQRVILLEEQRIGWGASGRNGGQIHPGFREGLRWFTETFGEEIAVQIHDASKSALAHLDGLISDLDIPCDRHNGLLTACRSQRVLEAELEAAAYAESEFGAPAVSTLTESETEDILKTGGHVGAVRDVEGGHLNPLVFVARLADAAEAQGAQLYDNSRVTALRTDQLKVEVETPHGTIRAQQVVLAGNGLMRGLHDEADARVLPITNFIVATEPIGAGQPGGILPTGDAVSDTRFVVRYWRPTPDGRLLFGGGEKFSTRFPKDIEAFVRRHLAEVYPSLETVRIDHAWGGTLAITLNRLPLIRRLGPRVTVAAGYSGQGVVNAPFAGKIIADALTHDPTLLDLMAKLPCPSFPGGPLLRPPPCFLR